MRRGAEAIRVAALGAKTRSDGLIAAPSTVGAVGRFMATSLVALVAFTAIGLYLQRRISTSEALHHSQATAQLISRGIIQPYLTDAALTGDPAALDRLDQVVKTRVLDDSIVRIKIWQQDGRIAYSDARTLVGQRYTLDPDDLEAFSTGGVESEVSDLSKPENALERSFGKLREVYLSVDTPSGQRVLAEMYERFDDVTSSERRLWLAFAPTLLGAIALLWLTQAPLAWSMARRLQTSQQERERLLEQAMEASEFERRQIAADLHDGVVQRLAGTAFSLAGTSERLPGATVEETGEAIDDAANNVRRAMQELRTLIVEIHPPILASEGLPAALQDLVTTLAARDINVQLDVETGFHETPETEKLLFRGAQEALRNVVAHSGASSVAISVVRDGGMVRLDVEDDGVGFSEEERAPRRREGHVGLTLLEELARNAGGSLDVSPRPSGGTRFRLEVPAG